MPARQLICGWDGGQSVSVGARRFTGQAAGLSKFRNVVTRHLGPRVFGCFEVGARALFGVIPRMGGLVSPQEMGGPVEGWAE